MVDANKAAATDQKVPAATGSNVQATAPHTASDPAKVTIRIIEANASKNAKAPKYRAFVEFDGSFANLVADMPIFQDAKDGSFSVAMPGGGFPAIRAKIDTTVVGGRTFADVNPQGKAKADRLLSATLEAFLLFRQTGVSEQKITL